MRMPSPFNANENQIHLERFFGKLTVPFALIPAAKLFNPGDIEKLSIYAGKISDKPEPYLDSALRKISENHFGEHLKISPGIECSVHEFTQGLKIQSVTIWPDLSWAMVFKSESGILANNVVYASFPSQGSSFTSLIAK